MTYRELLTALLELNESQLDQTATAHMVESDEYCMIELVGVACDTDVLDDNHIVLQVGY